MAVEPGLSEIVRSIRTAFRSLARAPGFSCIAILTIALGVGANTSMFNMMNAVLLRPLAFANAESLERIYRVTPEEPRGRFSPADLIDLRAHQGSYGRVVGFSYADASLAEPGEPPQMETMLRVSADFFSTLGVNPRMGRDFETSEDDHGRHRVLIISDRSWRDRFGSDPGVIGRPVRVNGETFTVIGVLPPSMNDWRVIGNVDLYRPMALTAAEALDRTSAKFNVIGRRADGIAQEQGAGLIARLGAETQERQSGTIAKGEWRTVPLGETIVPRSSQGILAMMVGLSGFVLLIACSNLAIATSVLWQPRSPPARSCSRRRRIPMTGRLIVSSSKPWNASRHCPASRPQVSPTRCRSLVSPTGAH